MNESKNKNKSKYDCRIKEKKNREVVLKEISSRNIILMPNGEEFSIDLENREGVMKLLASVGDEDLKDYVLSEELGISNHKEPLSIKEMMWLEFVDVESFSDFGNL